MEVFGLGFSFDLFFFFKDSFYFIEVVFNESVVGFMFEIM